MARGFQESLGVIRGITVGFEVRFDPKWGSLRTLARKKSSIAWSHPGVGGCTRRSTPGFLFCGND